MPQYGPVYPRQAMQLPSPYAYGASHAQNWDNPSAARVQDGGFAMVWTRGSDGQSHWLVLHDFDWSGLPDFIRIRGLKLDVLARCRRDTSPYGQLRYLRLRTTAYATQGWEASQRAGPWLQDAWGFMWFTVGGDGDTWGVTLERSHLNADFGVMISAFTSGWQTLFTPIGSTAEIEAVALTVYYDEVDPRENQAYLDSAAVMEGVVVEDLAAPAAGRTQVDFDYWFRGIPVAHLWYSGDMAYWREGVPEIQFPHFVVVVTDEVTGGGPTVLAGEADQITVPGETSPPPPVETDQGQRTVPGTGERAGGRYWEKEVTDTTWQKA